MSQTQYFVRCRGIIMHNGALLAVTHAGKEDRLVLPGGHMEFGEDIKASLIRELYEELGVKPVIGALLYVHTYTQANNVQSVEFFFHIDNSEAFLDCASLVGSHAHELAGVYWVTPTDPREFLPTGVWTDFKTGRLGDGTVRYLFQGQACEN